MSSWPTFILQSPAAFQLLHFLQLSRAAFVPRTTGSPLLPGSPTSRLNAPHSLGVLRLHLLFSRLCSFHLDTPPGAYSVPSGKVPT